MTTPLFDPDAAHRWLSRYVGLPGVVQIVDSNGWSGRCFPTTKAGIRCAVEYAAERDECNPTGVYYRLATLTEVPRRRGGADLTAVVPAIMSDLDIAGPGHKGTTLPPTEEAARALVAEAGLSAPTDWIHSGGGLYAVWWLAEPVDRATAEDLGNRVNVALKRAAHAHGWHVDTVSADTARVFRLPGSRNLKVPGDPCPCVVLEERIGARVTPDEFPPAPAPEPAPAPRRDRNPSDGPTPGDAFAEACEWAYLLAPPPLEWEFVGTDSGEKWRRPGASSEYSARAFEHNLVVHSSAIEQLPDGAGQKLTKLRVFAALHHGGDLSAATRDLIAASHGEACTEAAASLPDHVLDAVREVCPTEEERWARFGFDLAEIEARERTQNSGMHAQKSQNASGGSVTFVTASGESGIAATSEELESWIATFTTSGHPERLVRRYSWMTSDSPRRLGLHAAHLVAEAIAGDFPAEDAVRALVAAHQHHQVADHDLPRRRLSVALGAILNAKVGATR